MSDGASSRSKKVDPTFKGNAGQPLTFPVAPAVSLAAQDLTHGLLVIELQKKRIGYGRGGACLSTVELKCLQGWSACCAAHEASTATGEVWLGQQGGRQSKRGIW
ncbi:unnamed protein product [Musa textilis]